MTMDDFRTFASERIINAAEAAEILNCSRQYINELVKTDKLYIMVPRNRTTVDEKNVNMVE